MARGEEKDEDDKCEAKSANGDHVREEPGRFLLELYLYRMGWVFPNIPWNPKFQLVLDRHEPRENT